MSLSLAGYLACVADKSLIMIVIMQILAQGLFVAVLTQMPKLLKLKFYLAMQHLLSHLLLLRLHFVRLLVI